jgi:hypothetical protein
MGGSWRVWSPKMQPTDQTLCVYNGLHFSDLALRAQTGPSDSRQIVMQAKLEGRHPFAVRSGLTP